MPSAVGMVLFLDKDDNLVARGYQIVSVSHSNEYHVYDSLNNSWASRGIVPSDSLNNYFLRSKPAGIVSYNVARGAWEQLHVPEPPSTYHSSLFIAECEGRILLVGLEKQNLGLWVCVWELERGSLVWTEVDRMPNWLRLELRLVMDGDLVCLSNQRLLIMSPCRLNPIITYDVVSREWSKLPKLQKGKADQKRNPWTISFPLVKDGCINCFHSKR